MTDSVSRRKRKDAPHAAPSPRSALRSTRPRWIFWDIGDTLLNEDPLRYHIYELLHAALRRAGRAMTFPDLLGRRRELIERGDTRAHYTIAESELTEAQRERWRRAVRRYVCEEWPERAHLVPGTVETLAWLSEGHRMGLIADQPETIMRALVRLGVGRRFAVKAISSSVGYNKPDERLFRWALERAGCEPGEAVMVGNRLDTDIAPAKHVGMRTVLCAFSPMEKGWTPETENGRLYREAIALTPNWPAAPDPSDRHRMPDARVPSMRLIPSVMDVRSRA